ncbi:YncE family protein [Sphingosinicella rhizophila]|uniref:Uncharacterized protein n=1 Tax=Sphingosinicella rhizophila TaxID=3050082 RepID=A0ABU3QA15_9SPHN|nr:hypothetical protein [Sphingosinicella sp. GR2756]MDT9600233.1 hypothetical protein [Sphingosinicella sp. GR2756]
MEIDFSAPPLVRDALSRIGRTEDIGFSPSGDRIAIAGLLENRILLLDLDRQAGEFPEKLPEQLAVSHCVEAHSHHLAHPHGLCWIDDRMLVVANRAGGIVLFEVPPRGHPVSPVGLEPTAVLASAAHAPIHTPGSVSAIGLGGGLVELLVCNNYANTLSRHLLDGRAGYSALSSEILLMEGLRLPDGVAHSASGRWIAVSNHEAQAVLLYRNDRHLCPSRAPDATLHGIRYPHGLKFTPDEASLLVADAGAPLLHVFDSGDDGWCDRQRPARSIPIMDDATYDRGNYNHVEGGPKGIDISPDGGLIVLTCTERPLAFFRAGAIDDRFAPAPAALKWPAEELHRDALLRFAVAAQDRARAQEERIRQEARRDFDAIVRSRSWRFTEPLRRIARSARGLIPSGDR